MRAPSGLAGLTLTLGSAASPAAGSDLSLTICLFVVFRFLTGGSSDFLLFATSESSLGRLRSDVLRSDFLESPCCFKHKEEVRE